jgi:hypothetical protein
MYAGAQAGPTYAGAEVVPPFPPRFVQVSPVQTVQTSPGSADATELPHELPTTVQACAGGATATGAAAIARAADMAVTSHAASFFIS